MKIRTVGDIHGRDDWRFWYEKKDYDVFVFLGDYTDSFTESNEKIYSNLVDIISLPEDPTVIRLIGNHDLQYILEKNQEVICSGYRPESYAALHALFTENNNKFFLSYQQSNYIWTHAGICAGWLKSISPILETIRENYDMFNLSDMLNFLYGEKHKSLFRIGYDRGGHDRYGGPLWVSAETIKRNMLPDYHQIVGHTQMGRIHTHKWVEISTVTFCDVPGESYLLDIPEIAI